MDQLDNIIDKGFSFLQTGVGYDLLIEFSGALLFTVCGFIFLWARRSLGPKPHIEDFYRTLSEILHLLYSAQSQNQDGEISEEEKENEISVVMNKISWLTGQFSAASINQFSKKNQETIKEIKSELVEFHKEFKHRQKRGTRLTKEAKERGDALRNHIANLSDLSKGHKKGLNDQLDKLK